MSLETSKLAALVEACLREKMRSKPYGVEPKLIARSAGLEPLPPRTDLRPRFQAWNRVLGYERTIGTYEARPGEEVAVTVYRPTHPGPHPLVVLAPDLWLDGRRAPWAQAFGIALALHGFLVVVPDLPGVGDRGDMGNPLSSRWSSASPAVGVFAWDLIRAIDLAGAEWGVLGERVGLAGVGFGGESAVLTAALDPRVHVLALSGSCHSQETGVGQVYRSLPSIAAVGDWASVLAHREGLPVLLQAGEDDEAGRVEATAKKLRSTYAKNAQPAVRFESFLGGRDLNRRMRESMAAWFLHHLAGQGLRPHVAETIPLTDGQLNPHPANTEDASSLSLDCHSFSFDDLVRTALAEPYPEVDPELTPWAKYGRLDPVPDGEEIRLVDHGASPTSILIPYIDPEVLVPLGLSVPDFVAQLLHLLLPGGPEGWEPLGLQGDALTAMIASVRTLIKGAETKDPPRKVIAEGPVSSLAAHLLGRYRPQLEIATTHSFSSWAEVVESGIMIPGARYRRWPFGHARTADDLGQVASAALAEGLPADEPVGNEPNPSEQGEWHDEGHKRLDDAEHPAEAENRDDDDQAEFHTS